MLNFDFSRLRHLQPLTAEETAAKAAAAEAEEKLCQRGMKWLFFALVVGVIAGGIILFFIK